MQKTQTLLKPHKEGETKISYFSLRGLLLPDCMLALSPKTRTLLLLADGPRVLVEEQLSVNEYHVLLPILESFPHYCPYEILLAHISASIVTSISIARCRQRLHEAQTRGIWEQELRPIRRALSPLRNKLHNFDLEISNVRERGCSLTSLTFSQ
jgi:hypothetical protein